MPINPQTNWMRDYGPETVVDGSGNRAFVDMSYYPQPTRHNCNALAGRYIDDLIPTSLTWQADGSWDIPVHRAQIRYEGGAVQSDGSGTCFRTRRVANARNNWSRWHYGEDDVNDVLGEALGCDVVVLESMVGGVIDHIDMFLTFVSPDTVLVGQYDPGEDPENEAILDYNASFLAGLGYRVVRIPMPTPYCTVYTPGTCIGHQNRVRSCTEPNADRVWATYTNSIRLGDAMVVPVYHAVPEDVAAEVAAEEAEALAIYQQVLDEEFGVGAVEVIPSVSDTIIPCQGAAHCSTMTYR